MSLADYQPEKRVIQLGNTSFAVTGLSLTSITTLVREHLPDLESVVDIAAGSVADVDNITSDDVGRVAVALAEQAPGFVGNLIALAAGETNEKAVAAAMSMPFPTQVHTIVQIIDVTFAEVGGVKKAIEAIAGLGGQVKTKMKALSKPDQ